MSLNAHRSLRSTTVYLIERLKALSAASKVPQAALFREAIAMAMPRWERELEEGLPLTFSDSPPAETQVVPEPIALVRKKPKKRAP